MPIQEVFLNPPGKFFRVRVSPFNKFHIAREKEDGGFKTLCGLVFSLGTNPFAVSITSYRGDECLRCQRCTRKKKRRTRWKAERILIRLQKTVDSEPIDKF